VKRSLRHPISGSKQYLRAERDRFGPRKVAKQPRIHKSRVSVGSMLDAPDSTASRPGLRLRITGLVVIALFAVLGLRLWALQVLQAPAAVHAVSANQIRVVSIPPTRGEILDRSGTPLVNNIVTQQITLSRVAAVQHPEVIGRLAALLVETTATVNQAINNKQYSPYKPVPIATVTGTQLSAVLYIKENPDQFPGVSVTQTTERNYPQAELPGPATTGAGSGYPGAQTLGYVGAISASELKTLAAKGYQAGDQVGQSGLEYQYESALQGKSGQQQLEVDAQGQVVGTLKTMPAKSGDDLVTNIDLGLQQVADDALATQIIAVRQIPDAADNNALPPAINGSVVVMNPQTGAILAMASYPSYNPTVWVGGISTASYDALQADQSLNNWAINSQLAPGSTFKLVTATSALQTGLITPNYTFDDTGSFTAPGCTGGAGCTLKDDIGDAPAGDINVSQAITASSDTFFYNIGAMYWDAKSQYGNEPIQTTAAQYGYGQPTGIDIPNESIGRVDSKTVRDKLHAENPTGFPNDTWYTGDNMELAFGQGGTVITPLQEAVAYSTFANGSGTRYAPEVAAGVVSPDGKVVSTIAPKVTGHVTLSPTNYQAMLAGFEGVIASPSGTGYGSFVGDSGAPWDQAAFPLGGKTGTASVNGQEPTSWFVAFGPNPNPQYVVVSEINEGGYGAQASAPVVRKIFDYLAAHPVTPVALPPSTAAMNATGPAALPSTTTTTTTAPGSTTTTTGAGSTTTSGATTTTTTAPGTATGTGAAYRARTPTTKAHQAKGSGHSP
jgi:penicillin-binding protein 2